MREMKLLMKRLNELTRKHKLISGGYCKPVEPSLSITFLNDNTWSAEIYSYLLNFQDGGRHHHFYAKTYSALIKILKRAISKEEGLLKK